MVMEKYFRDLKKRVDKQCQQEQAKRQSFHMAKTLTEQQRNSKEYISYLLENLPISSTKQ